MDHAEFLSFISLYRDYYRNLSEEEYEHALGIYKKLVMANVTNRKLLVDTTLEGHQTGFKEFNVGNQITSLILLRIFNQDKELELSDSLFDGFDIKSPFTYNKYYTALYKYLINLNVNKYNIYSISNYISDVIDELSKFSSTYVLEQKGSTISLFDIIHMYNKAPRLKELMEYKPEEGKDYSIKELVDIQASNKKEAIDIINNLQGDNPYKDFIDSQSGINLNQFVEVFLTIMYKPDPFGNVIPIPIFTSFANGLKDVVQYYIDCIGARTALIASKIQVKKSGYLNRKMSNLTTDIVLGNIHDCGSKRYVDYRVETQSELDLIDGRYIVDDNDELHLIDSKKDTDLIGQVVALRSPIYCALNDNKICDVCYGKLAKRNRGLGIGTLATLLFTEPLTQGLLSMKHILKVSVDKLNLPDKFEDYFEINADRISTIDPDTEIIIPRTSLIERDREIDKYAVKNFFVKKSSERTRTEFTFSNVLTLIEEVQLNMKTLYNPETEEYVFSKNMISDENLFKFKISNNSVADPLMNCKNAIDLKGYMDNVAKGDPSIVLNYMIEQLSKSGTSVQSVHLEVIIRNLVHFNNNPSYDRSRLKDPELYNEDTRTMKTIQSSILASNSISRSLSFQYVSKQLMTDSYQTFLKNGTSRFDLQMK